MQLSIKIPDIEVGNKRVEVDVFYETSTKGVSFHSVEYEDEEIEVSDQDMIKIAEILYDINVSYLSAYGDYLYEQEKDRRNGF